jgi:hypothetical protein
MYIDPTTMVDREKPTIAELQARAPKLNLALELCPKRIYPELSYQNPPNGLWPYINARKRSRELPTNDPKSYDFAEYFDPNNRQLLKVAPAMTHIIDPWTHPYQYLIFEEITNVMQPDGVTMVAKSVFIEVISSSGPDMLTETTMTNFNSAGGYIDFAAHPVNDDDAYAEIGRWSPKKN